MQSRLISNIPLTLGSRFDFGVAEKLHRGIYFD